MSPLMPEKQSKYASFMGVRHNRGNPGAELPSPQEMCRREHFDSIGGVARCQIRDGVTPLPPTFPDLRILKDLEPTHLGSAHSKGVMQGTLKVKDEDRRAMTTRGMGVTLPRNRIAEMCVLVKNLIV